MVLDPELGSDMDVVTSQWVEEDLCGADPNDLLLSKAFDAPEMKRVNGLLDRYALEYNQREEQIKAYLKSIGHPLGA